MFQPITGKQLHEIWIAVEKEEQEKRPDIQHTPLPSWARMSAHSQKIYNLVAGRLTEIVDES